jgi:ethanolamine ammonia-lyase small subunit
MNADSADPSPWDRLKHFTRARIDLGRAGDSLPTAALLDFQMAHARARDAVHGAVDWARISAALAPLETIRLSSAAPERAVFLRRPDLGRTLAAGEAEKLPSGPYDLVFIIGDGLSAAACDCYAAATVRASLPKLEGLTVAPIVLARGARVALSDPIGAALRARLAIMLIGERPGLSTADSLGAYLTFAPQPGRRNSERNCLSNIHGHGLAPEQAAVKVAWLAREALRLRLTGVTLKEAAPVDALVTSKAGGALAPASITSSPANIVLKRT